VTHATGDATVYWSVSVERGVISRGERAVKLAPGQPGVVTIDVTFPELRPGLVVAGALSLEVRSRTGGRAEKAVPLFVFSPDVIAHRTEWLKSIEISLFDPAQKTAAALEASQIPFQLMDGPGPRGTGLMIYGEGMEPGRQVNSWPSAVAAARAGRKVIVLASSGAGLPLDEVMAAGDNALVSASLKRNDFIRELDRRLDAGAWPEPARLVASSLHWTARSNAPRLELQPDAEGWSWLDLRYRNGGRLVWTGVGLIESWESTPAARYLFVKLLEDVMIEKPESGGSKHARE
jgi:hypothetical protein